MKLILFKDSMFEVSFKKISKAFKMIYFFTRFKKFIKFYLSRDTNVTVTRTGSRDHNCQELNCSFVHEMAWH